MRESMKSLSSSPGHNLLSTVSSFLLQEVLKHLQNVLMLADILCCLERSLGGSATRTSEMYAIACLVSGVEHSRDNVLTSNSDRCIFTIQIFP